MRCRTNYVSHFRNVTQHQGTPREPEHLVARMDHPQRPARRPPAPAWPRPAGPGATARPGSPAPSSSPPSRPATAPGRRQPSTPWPRVCPRGSWPASRTRACATGPPGLPDRRPRRRRRGHPGHRAPPARPCRRPRPPGQHAGTVSLPAHGKSRHQPDPADRSAPSAALGMGLMPADRLTVPPADLSRARYEPSSRAGTSGTLPPGPRSPQPTSKTPSAPTTPRGPPPSNSAPAAAGST